MNQLRDIATMDREEMEVELQETQEKLDHTSKQIAYVDTQINYLRKLFRRAVRNNGYAVRYNLRMQLSIMSGVKVMHNHFAAALEARASNLLARLHAISPTSDGSASSDVDELVD